MFAMVPTYRVEDKPEDVIVVPSTSKSPIRRDKSGIPMTLTGESGT